MTRGVASVLLTFLAAGFGVGATVLLLRSPGSTAKNYRGREVPVVLGIAAAAALFAAVLVVFSIVLWSHRPGRPEVIRREALFTVVACLIVFLGGLYDDRAGGPERGLVAHFRELLDGRVTPGIVKLVAAVAAASLVAWAYRPPLFTAIMGIPVMAGAANLWNLLDVRPGRALKYFIPFCSVLLIASGQSQYALVASAALGASLAVFAFDLTERAMLGDAGSNLFGFVVGVGLFQALPVWGLVFALGVILALHWAAETVTLSRIIESTPPLQWFDRLGVRAEESRERKDSEESRHGW
jgi:UDP-GlcNAc:undecaprenyl-phosphate GlcNAc-1-phosphate transferase